MAVLTSDNLTELRQRFEADGITNPFIKTSLNAVFQGIEDWFEANRASLSGAIDTVFPGLTNAQKKALVKYWLFQKFNRGG